MLRRHKLSQSIDGSQAGSIASERPSQAISVMTPSVAHFSRATSTDYRNFHTSNPNPQGNQSRYAGPRDQESSKGMSSPDVGADLVRFGKKIAFGGRMTNEELLQDHLREMRQHLIEKKAARETQLEQEKSYLKKVAAKDQAESANKIRSSEILKNEFLFFND